MTQDPRTPVRPSRRRWVPPIAALLVALVGLLDLASALTRGLGSRLHTLTMVVPGALTTAAAALTTVTGVLLLMLARALRRRKRRAWRATVALLVASVVLHVVKGLDVEEALVAVGLLVALVAFRDEFTAKADPRARVAAVGAFLWLGLVSLVLGYAVVLLRLDDVVGPHGALAVTAGALGLVGVSGPLRFLTEGDADVVAFTLGALGALTVIVTTYLVLRPAEPRAFLTAEDEERLRGLLGRYGSADSLGYFALRRDKSVLWAPSGNAAVAYRVVSGVMLASGDPLGEPGSWPDAIEAFLAEADEHAWVPAVMGCSEEGGQAWAKAGLAALEIGDEAVVEVAEFSLEGRAMRGVRQAVNKVERAGYTAQVRRLDQLTEAERATVRREADAWRGTETERGFSMALGRFGETVDDCCVLVTAEKDGALRAFLHFVPWGRDGLSLDLMRRDREADNGLNEFLIVSALAAAPGLGVTRVSLNFAVFRAALERGERLGAGPVLKAWRNLLVFASRWFQIETLYRFNAKFRPSWEPRFVCYPSTADLPRIALASLEAEAFIVWPRPSLRRVATAFRLRPRTAEVTADLPG